MKKKSRKIRKAKYYCGNNYNARKGKPVGSRSTCLRIGIGKGKFLPCEASYAGPYVPIDTRKIYCGDKTALPPGYDLVGSPSLCLKTGIGLGKALRAQSGCKIGKKKSKSRKKRRKKKSKFKMKKGKSRKKCLTRKRSRGRKSGKILKRKLKKKSRRRR